MSEIKKKLPVDCPACNERLKVKKLHCTNCQTEVEGLFDFPALINLNQEEQHFILDFVRTSGSLKEMAKIMNRSYPSVRNYLDEVIKKLENPTLS